MNKSTENESWVNFEKRKIFESLEKRTVHCKWVGK